MGLKFHKDSGFAAVGEEKPRIDAPADWLAWHFTTWANLGHIADDGYLKPDRLARPADGVGDPGIKHDRMKRPVVPHDTPNYPSGMTVGDHVPFYFAPRSPMLYRVLAGAARYDGDHTGLVMLGVCLRTIIESGATWCVSDMNAGSPVVRFTCDLNGVGGFIDFPLMTQRVWRKTPDDPARQTRRAAELLVLRQLPVALVTHVVTSTAAGVGEARRIMQTVGGTRQYEVEPCFLYR